MLLQMPCVCMGMLANMIAMTSLEAILLLCMVLKLRQLRTQLFDDRESPASLPQSEENDALFLSKLDL